MDVKTEREIYQHDHYQHRTTTTTTRQLLHSTYSVSPPKRDFCGSPLSTEWFLTYLLSLSYHKSVVLYVNEQSAQRRRKHCALAVVRRSQKISSRRRPLSGGAGRPKFNQLEMVNTFTYKHSLMRKGSKGNDSASVWRRWRVSNPDSSLLCAVTVQVPPLPSSIIW